LHTDPGAARVNLLIEESDCEACLEINASIQAQFEELEAQLGGQFYEQVKMPTLG